MSPRERKTRVGLIGCGAIGSRIAQSIVTDLRAQTRLTALYDIDVQKSTALQQKLHKRGLSKKSLTALLTSCDFVVEAVNAKDTGSVIKKVLQAKKNILVMSTGKILNATDLFTLAQKNRCSLLLPSGAIAGLDAIKAAGLLNFSSLTLTTRKPLSGFQGVDYLRKRGIDPDRITGETVLFDGNVDDAVTAFPQNINVAATLALAAAAKDKLRVRILTSPDITTNSHEIEATGDFGRIVGRTENVICPDNPKTSYLAVLSGIQTLKQFFNKTKIGT